MNSTRNVDQLHDEQYRVILPALSSQFEQRDQQHSRLDPRSYRGKHFKKLNALVPVLLRAHRNNLDDWKHLFSNQQLKQFYSVLLEGLLLVVFESSNSVVGLGSNMEFLKCVLRTYEYLYAVSKEMPSSELDKDIASFQQHFMKNWNKVQSETLLFDQVRDLLSHSHDIVAPPLFDEKDVIKRGYFKLSCQQLNYDNLWVELFHMKDGGVAIFEVNSQTLPLCNIEQTHELLLRMSKSIDMGFYHDSLFQIGRTLLFPTIRAMDLRIAEESKNKVILQTKTGNNVALVLNPYDTISWAQYWSPLISSLCAELQQNKVLANTKTSLLGDLIAKPSDDYMDSKGSRGLGISFNKPDSETNLKSELHRSKPLSPDFPSISQIESFDFKKLMELNDSTDASTAGSSIKSPVVANLKRVEGPSSIQQLSPVIGSDTVDIDSIISEDSGIRSQTDNTSPTVETSPVFSLSAETHRPQLTKRKSSSLLSLFKKDKSKNKKESTGSLLSLEDKVKPLFRESSATSTPNLSMPELSTPSLPATATMDTKCEIPSNITLFNDCILLDVSIKISYWRSNKWQYISSGWAQLQVLNSNQDKYMFLVRDKSSNVKLCLTITDKWSISRTTAQDIQIRIPAADVVCSVVNPTPTMLSVRCPQVESISNVLKHCKRKNIIPTSTNHMSSSATQSTLQSNESSILSNGKSDSSFSRSSTASNDLSSSLCNTQSIPNSADYKSLLLLSKIKVRLHKYDEQYGWNMCKTGLLNVYSREYNGSLVGCKFEIDESESIISSFIDLKRIGRTGIAAGENLFEFKNQSTADETYSLLCAL